ncbi:MAG: twin-arginine translocase TatA/TatE family subunit [Deltaproteobacteria bacterium]|nr:twin-arginine translocase TatA/TatE family subunit [Deltaproteobacteria bacterium]
MFGWLEFAIIAVIVLVLFGGTRLPGIAQGLGKAFRNIKYGIRGDDGIEVRRVNKEDD